MELDLKDLFFPVSPSDLYLHHDQNANQLVPHYFALTRADTGAYLGVKDARRNRKSVFSDHKTAAELGETVFRDLFGRPGEVIQYYGEPPFAWAMMLIGAQKDGRPRQHTLFDTNIMDFKLGRLDLESLFWQGLVRRNERVPDALREATAQAHGFDESDSLAAVLRNFSPLIAVSNGFDLEDQLTIHLLLVHRALPSLDREAIGKMSMLSLGGMSPDRPLANFQYGEMVPDLRSHDDFRHRVATDLMEKLNGFVQDYDLLLHMPLEPQYLGPLILDIHNMNRQPATIKKDRKLQQRLAAMCAEANLLYSLMGRPRISYASILDYIMQKYAFSFGVRRQKRSAIEEALTHRRIYRIGVDRFEVLFADKEGENDYLEGNQTAYQNVIKTLSKIERQGA